MKRAFFVIFSLLSICAAAAVRGDANGDGVVDIDDLNAVINVMLRKATNLAADINGNGVTDIDDVNIVVNVMLHKAEPDPDPENEPLPADQYEDALIGGEWYIILPDEQWRSVAQFKEDGTAVVTDGYDMGLDHTYSESLGKQSGYYVFDDASLEINCGDSKLNGFYTILSMTPHVMVLRDEQGNEITGNRNRGLTSLKFAGSGTLADPYLIACAADLWKLSDDVAAGEQYIDSYFKLTCDVYINKKVHNDDGTLFTPQREFVRWQPIGTRGTSVVAFRGILNGNGHSIYGLFIDEMGDNRRTGLFGQLSGKIVNLSIKDSYINVISISGRTICVGAFAGDVKTSTDDKTGLKTAVESCSNYAEIQVSGSSHAGGFVGLASGGNAGYGRLTMSKCTNYGKITSNSSHGGIVGECKDHTLTMDKCVNYAEITGGLAGGIVGDLYFVNQGSTIMNCINFGCVTGEYCGGLAHSYNGDIKIYNFINYGEIGTSETIDAGGIIRDAEPNMLRIGFYAKNVINYGKVNGTGKIGAVLGFYQGNSRVTATTAYFHYLNSTCSKAVGTYNINCPCVMTSMTTRQLKDQTFLDQLNANAASLGENYSQWKFDSDGLPTLEWVDK